MLLIFAMNPANVDAEVEWEFGPIVHAGWVGREAFQPGARREQTILVTTEGARPTPHSVRAPSARRCRFPSLHRCGGK